MFDIIFIPRQYLGKELYFVSRETYEIVAKAFNPIYNTPTTRRLALYRLDRVNIYYG